MAEDQEEILTWYGIDDQPMSNDDVDCHFEFLEDELDKKFDMLDRFINGMKLKLSKRELKRALKICQENRNLYCLEEELTSEAFLVHQRAQKIDIDHLQWQHEMFKYYRLERFKGLHKGLDRNMGYLAPGKHARFWYWYKRTKEGSRLTAFDFLHAVIEDLDRMLEIFWGRFYGKEYRQAQREKPERIPAFVPKAWEKGRAPQLGFFDPKKRVSSGGIEATPRMMPVQAADYDADYDSDCSDTTDGTDMVGDADRYDTTDVMDIGAVFISLNPVDDVDMMDDVDMADMPTI